MTTGIVFSESVVEQAALTWLQGLGYTVLHGPDIAPGEADAGAPVAAQCVIVFTSPWSLGKLD